MSSAARRMLLGVVAIAVVLVAAGVWILRGPGPMAFSDGKKVTVADYKAADPTGVPASIAKASLVERGAYLARAADCVACHTSGGGKEYAGGLAIRLPFGTLYSTNITPDRETGIGNYSDQDFLNALHRGIRRDGVRLYPAMPYTSYSYVTDADALAIKAYLFSLPPVHAKTPENTLTFPYNQRWAMIFWSALFNPDTRFAPDSDRSPEWNRGAYLAEALAHCGECHTPRNLAFALDNRKKFAGALTAGWRAFNISSDKATGIGGWGDEDLADYLAIGHADGHGTASGPMGEAVDHSFSQLAPEDIRAVVAYLRTVPAMVSPDLPATLAPPAPASHRQGGGAGQDAVRRRLRQLPRLGRREPGLVLRHAHRRMGGQRSQRNKCRPGGAFRHQAPDAGICHLDAAVRRRLFRCRDRGSCQLRHRPLRNQGIASHRAGRGGVEETNVSVKAGYG
jgi:mono/diheme cytochrome c family protein